MTRIAAGSANQTSADNLTRAVPTAPGTEITGGVAMTRLYGLPGDLGPDRPAGPPAGGTRAPVEAHAFLKDVKRWEGDHQFMYLDTRGYVTTGIGHLLKNADAAVDLPWRHRSTGQPATQAEVRAAFNNLKQMWTDHRQDHPKGPNPFTAEHYERKSDLVLPERLSETLALARLQKEFLGGLRRIFPGFDQYPTPAQRALVDMAYNLGVGKLERSFPNLVDACRAGDFDVAAAESRRTSSRANRNAETRDLFLQADQLKTSIRTFSREVRP